MCPLGTWFVWGICGWIPCIKETMVVIIIIIIIIITEVFDMRMQAIGYFSIINIITPANINTVMTPVRQSRLYM